MTSSRRTTAQAAGLLLAGAVAGAVLAVTIGANASSPSAGTGGPASYAATGGGPGAPGAPGAPGRGPRPAMQAGTVTAVGSKSVTIKGTSGTKTYAVDANSDIDKNGEAKLSDLKAGDAVHFAVRPGTSTIAVLHAGDEAKNRPAFGRGGPGGPGHPCPGMGGPGPGQPAPAPTTSSNA